MSSPSCTGTASMVVTTPAPTGSCFIFTCPTRIQTQWTMAHVVMLWTMMVRRRVNLYCAQCWIKHQGYRRPGKIGCLGLNKRMVFSIENTYSLDLIKWCLINILGMMISNPGFPFPGGSQREQVFCQTLEMLYLSHISYYLQFFSLKTKSLGD